MALTERDKKHAEARMQALRKSGHVVAARYEHCDERLVLGLNNGIEISIPIRLIEGLAGADHDKLANIEISPSGLGLHWPVLDADVYVPALLEGVFGSRRWMAQQLGASGGRSRSAAKAAASRANGRKGGRPRKQDGNAL